MGSSIVKQKLSQLVRFIVFLFVLSTYISIYNDTCIRNNYEHDLYFILSGNIKNFKCGDDDDTDKDVKCDEEFIASIKTSTKCVCKGELCNNGKPLYNNNNNGKQIVTNGSVLVTGSMTTLALVMFITVSWA
jgi:hypothetical protein